MISQLLLILLLALLLIILFLPNKVNLKYHNFLYKFIKIIAILYLIL